jgi:hypothetical protein
MSCHVLALQLHVERPLVWLINIISSELL